MSRVGHPSSGGTSPHSMSHQPHPIRGTNEPSSQMQNLQVMFSNLSQPQQNAQTQQNPPRTQPNITKEKKNEKPKESSLKKIKDVIEEPDKLITEAEEPFVEAADKLADVGKPFMMACMEPPVLGVCIFLYLLFLGNLLLAVLMTSITFTLMIAESFGVDMKVADYLYTKYKILNKIIRAFKLQKLKWYYVTGVSAGVFAVLTAILFVPFLFIRNAMPEKIFTRLLNITRFIPYLLAPVAIGYCIYCLIVWLIYRKSKNSTEKRNAFLVSVLGALFATLVAIAYRLIIRPFSKPEEEKP